MGTVTLCEKNNRIGKKEEKIETKYIWETLDVIHYCHQPILHISKIMVYLYYIDERINKFSIGCMIHPSLHVNKMFR